MKQAVSLRPLFAAMDSYLNAQRRAREAQRPANEGVRTALDRHMRATTAGAADAKLNGFKRMQLVRDALEAMDRQGWDRSHHQRVFHEVYLKACVRVFFKRDGPGAFARSHNRVLELNGWDATPQEVLVSTPRRFGKTISVSMFAAALIFAAPAMELSIYSTCKRISQKLLRNIMKFLDLIYIELGVAPYKTLRQNSEVALLLHGRRTLLFFVTRRRRSCTSRGRRGTATSASSTATRRRSVGRPRRARARLKKQ